MVEVKFNLINVKIYFVAFCSIQYISISLPVGYVSTAYIEQ